MTKPQQQKPFQQPEQTQQKSNSKQKPDFIGGPKKTILGIFGTLGSLSIAYEASEAEEKTSFITNNLNKITEIAQLPIWDIFKFT